MTEIKFYNTAKHIFEQTTCPVANSVQMIDTLYVLMMFNLKKAAELGHSESQFVLAKIYYFGIGTIISPNLSKCKYWCERAKSGGHTNATLVMNTMFALAATPGSAGSAGSAATKTPPTTTTASIAFNANATNTTTSITDVSIIANAIAAISVSDSASVATSAKANTDFKCKSTNSASNTKCSAKCGANSSGNPKSLYHKGIKLFYDLTVNASTSAATPSGANKLAAIKLFQLSAGIPNEKLETDISKITTTNVIANKYFNADSRAEFQLGQLAFCNKRYVLAYQWFTKSAAQCNPCSQFFLGYLTFYNKLETPKKVSFKYQRNLPQMEIVHDDNLLNAFQMFCLAYQWLLCSPELAHTQVKVQALSASTLKQAQDLPSIVPKDYLADLPLESIILLPKVHAPAVSTRFKFCRFCKTLRDLNMDFQRMKNAVSIDFFNKTQSFDMSTYDKELYNEYFNDTRAMLKACLIESF